LLHSIITHIYHNHINLRFLYIFGGSGLLCAMPLFRLDDLLKSLALLVLGLTVNPISTRRKDYAQHSTSPPGFSDLATALHYLYKYIGILFPKLFWPTVRKNWSSDQEKLLKFEAEGWEFAKFLRSLEQFIQTVKGQNNFW
jgi:hypothetical protein